MADNVLTLPINVNAVMRGNPVAVFVRGFEAYDMRGPITIRGTNDSVVEGQIVNTEVGRFFNLAQRFSAQSIYAAPAAAANPGYYNPESALFDALGSDEDPKALHPLTAYTVVIVNIPLGSPANAPTPTTGPAV